MHSLSRLGPRALAAALAALALGAASLSATALAAAPAQSHGNSSTWQRASQATQNVAIKRSQIITFAQSISQRALGEQISQRAFGEQTPARRVFVLNSTFTINPLATATSGLPITYGTSTPTVCSVNGTTVTMLSLGTCTITADQAGNDKWLPAPQATTNVVFITSATPVPTLSEWGVILLSLLAAGFGVLRLRRRG